MLLLLLRAGLGLPRVLLLWAVLSLPKILLLWAALSLPRVLLLWAGLHRGTRLLLLGASLVGWCPRQAGHHGLQVSDGLWRVFEGACACTSSRQACSWGGGRLLPCWAPGV